MTSPSRIGARDLIDLVADPGSWTSWDEPPLLDDVDATYAADLAAARTRAGTDESIVTGRCLVRGRDVVVVASEFRFLGGSIGRAAATRIEAAVRRATREGLPILAAPASGGTRMQEGTPAFVTILSIARAVADHQRAGLPYLVYLRHPTTGGVMASWGSLGHVTAAEPGALIGFLGPLVYQALMGEPFPEGVQRAEHLLERGVIDLLARPDEVAEFVARTLAVVVPSERRTVADPTLPPDEARGSADAWASIQLSRRPDRPGVRQLLAFGTDPGMTVPADLGPSHGAVVCALASFRGIACAVIGQDRASQAAGRLLGPDDLRAARRWMRMAGTLRLPVVCVVDTPGAELSVDAEERAVAGQIARSVADLQRLEVPTVSVILGEGCGGGALALVAAERVIVAEHGWLSPLPPEGASAIMHGTTEFAADMARRQRVASADLIDDGIAHVVVPEPVPAHEDPSGFCRRVGDEIARQLALASRASARLVPDREHCIH